ncbi:alpha/beta fold hydrolase [Enterobacteriales bacterium SAP-6]|uniref:Alpha/beta fold hydrolase n=1 Tax=Acerihabitans arboris TaxID=2691583 RepID=A0A845SET1_9GAMM|nr:alpha/beta fold hydrolase [Acerihabitans arboris]
MLSEYTIPGMLIRDRLVTVPLDWTRPEDGRTIKIFAREVVDPLLRDADLPKLAYVQGGPGGKGPRPGGGGPAWLAEALKTHRVILVDQRGTGRSTRVESATLSAFGHADAAADYLWLFRADSIVHDYEYLRTSVFGGGRWEILGQSYGGFISLSYLSMAPQGLAACYITGGLAGLDADADDVYRRTYPRVAAKNDIYYRRYPDDDSRIARVAEAIAAHDVRLPDGDRLSVRRLQTLGNDFGMAPGFENIHWLMDEAFSDQEETRLSDHFLASVMALTSYDGNPLYAVLQEIIYGHDDRAGRWSAERMRTQFPEFAPERRPLLFTGEMMYPWMFEEIRSLRPFREVAGVLAGRGGYPPLYDHTRLAANEVPVAAAVYHDDMFVDAGLSLDTAGRVGNLQAWVTNEYQHDGLRQSASVLRRLLEDIRLRGGPIR